ncbi:type II and III secretion system protein family protein [Sphingobium indicum]|uniref:Pilus assembly protein CpaC n=2 Tax=Sphingobium indicum TaxID=332055 RepID=A0A1L5BLL9_SPHIB|nr:type II and III secretion system protein family protein [Sphingobium indicum]APL93763.1 pilus assembly protein CpaC [Sphingobium indicum B90A]RYM04510.1 type II and III secretion system protein family protein [Sphingobium indicum]
MLASLLALGAGASLLPMQAQAQVASLNVSNANHAGQLDVPLNKSQVLTVDRPFAKALVGNAEIADVLPMTNRSVYVLGKKMGTTSLTLYDSRNMMIAVVDVAVGPDVVTLKRQLSDLLPGQPIGARISNDAVVLTGTVSSAAAVDRAVQIAKTYAGDKVVNMMSVGAAQQVMLEVRFSEMTRSAAKQLNINHSFVNDSGKFVGGIGDVGSKGAAAIVSGGTVDLAPLTNGAGVLGRLTEFAGLNIASALDALERKGLATTLAEPTLIALSGETASFLAGGEFPIPVAQSNSGGGGGGGGGGGTNAITVEFKPFGVSLGFTPTVLEDGIINLVVEPEVSSIDPSASVTINGLTIPGLQTRRASSTLELRDGQSFALAGLLRKDFQDTVRQFPILGSIPIIGALFRSSGFQKSETELVIIVTPRLVKPMRAEDVALPTDRVKPPHELDLFLMGRTDKAVGINPLNPDAMPPEAPKKAPAPAKEAPASGKTPSGYEL